MKRFFVIQNQRILAMRGEDDDEEEKFYFCLIFDYMFFFSIPILHE